MGEFKGRLGKQFPYLDGIIRDKDPGGIPENAFRDLVNVRILSEGHNARGGQSKLSDQELPGCFTGIWPPERTSTNERLSALLISRASDDLLFSGPVWIYAPDQPTGSQFQLIGSPVVDGIRGWLWDNERLIYVSATAPDTNDAAIEQALIYRGSDEIRVWAEPNTDFTQDISSIWQGFCGGAVRVGSDYFFSRYAEDEIGAEQRVEKYSFLAGTWSVTNERNNASGDESINFLYRFADNRLAWLSDSAADSVIDLRSQDGTWTQITCPSGFSAIADLASQTIFNEKLYIAGAISSALKIVLFDPVASTATTVHTVSGASASSCPMTIHRGSIFYTWTDGADWFLGQARNGTFDDSVVTLSGTTSVNHLLSFDNVLYATRGLTLLAYDDDTATFSTAGSDTTGNPFRYMVGIP